MMLSAAKTIRVFSHVDSKEKLGVGRDFFFTAVWFPHVSVSQYPCRATHTFGAEGPRGFSASSWLFSRALR